MAAVSVSPASSPADTLNAAGPISADLRDVDIARLKELRQGAAGVDDATRRKQWEASYNLEAKHELTRLEAAEGIVGGFRRRLERAASNDAEFCRLLRLDATAHSDDPAAPAPATREHLRSPAYKMLWDYAVSQNVEPFIYKETVIVGVRPAKKSGSDESGTKASSPPTPIEQISYWIAVHMPKPDAPVVTPPVTQLAVTQPAVTQAVVAQPTPVAEVAKTNAAEEPAKLPPVPKLAMA